jgi:hypothetical protein
MSFNPLTRLSTGGSLYSASITGNIAPVSSHSDSLNATLYVLGDCALNGTCHAKTLKSTLPAVFQSDQNKKTNFKSIENPFYAMDRIPGYSFDYIENNIASLGFKAQDIEKIFPFLITDTNGTKYVSYIPLIAVNWEATKELRDRQRHIDTRVQILEEENSHLRNMLKMIPRLNTKIQQLEMKLSSFEVSSRISHSLNQSNQTCGNVDHTESTGRHYQCYNENIDCSPSVNLTNERIRKYLRRVKSGGRGVGGVGGVGGIA